MSKDLKRAITIPLFLFGLVVLIIGFCTGWFVGKAFFPHQDIEVAAGDCIETEVVPPEFGLDEPGAYWAVVPPEFGLDEPGAYWAEEWNEGDRALIRTKDERYFLYTYEGGAWVPAAEIIDPYGEELK